MRHRRPRPIVPTPLRKAAVGVAALAVVLSGAVAAPGAIAQTTSDQETTGSLTWFAADDAGSAVAETVYELAGPDGMERPVVDNGGQDSNTTTGTITLDELPVGEYTITQVGAPDGYELGDGPQQVVVTEQGQEPAAPITFVNAAVVAEDEAEPVDESTEPVEESAEDAADETTEPVAEDEPTEEAEQPATADVSATQVDVVGGDSSDDSEATLEAIEPLASTTSTDLTIHARVLARPLGTDGSTGSDYSYTVGTTFRLWTYSTRDAGPQAPINQPWATCTITSGGACTIEVPGTNNGGANDEARFWVVQEPVDISTQHGPIFQNDQLLLGSYTGPTMVRHIVGATNQMVPNTTQNLPLTSAGTVNDGGTWPSGGTYGGRAVPGSFSAVANSYPNPQVAPSCDTELKIAIVADESSSISQTQWNLFRSALMGSNGLFDTLQGSGTSIAYFSFSANSPASGVNYPQPLPLDSQRSAIENRIRNNRAGGNTNWDRGLTTVGEGNTAYGYDIILFITDGAPNYISNGSGTGGDCGQRQRRHPAFPGGSDLLREPDQGHGHPGPGGRRRRRGQRRGPQPAGDLRPGEGPGLLPGGELGRPERAAQRHRQGSDMSGARTRSWAPGRDAWSAMIRVRTGGTGWAGGRSSRPSRC